MQAQSRFDCAGLGNGTTYFDDEEKREGDPEVGYLVHLGGAALVARYCG